MTVVCVSTGCPFTVRGLNCHCFTAAMAAVASKAGPLISFTSYIASRAVRTSSTTAPRSSAAAPVPDSTARPGKARFPPPHPRAPRPKAAALPPALRSAPFHLPLSAAGEKLLFHSHRAAGCPPGRSLSPSPQTYPPPMHSFSRVRDPSAQLHRRGCRISARLIPDLRCSVVRLICRHLLGGVCSPGPGLRPASPTARQGGGSPPAHSHTQ